MKNEQLVVMTSTINPFIILFIVFEVGWFFIPTTKHNNDVLVLPKNEGTPWPGNVTCGVHTHPFSTLTVARMKRVGKTL